MTVAGLDYWTVRELSMCYSSNRLNDCDVSCVCGSDLNRRGDGRCGMGWTETNSNCKCSLNFDNLNLIIKAKITFKCAKLTFHLMYGQSDLSNLTFQYIRRNVMGWNEVSTCLVVLPSNVAEKRLKKRRVLCVFSKLYRILKICKFRARSLEAESVFWALLFRRSWDDFYFRLSSKCPSSRSGKAEHPNALKRENSICWQRMHEKWSSIFKIFNKFHKHYPSSMFKKGQNPRSPEPK